MTYRFHLVCPSCGKTNSDQVRDNLEPPTVSCGDCLMDRVEMVRMTVDRVEDATGTEEVRP